MPYYILAVFWLYLPLYGIVDHDFYCATLLLLPFILDINSYGTSHSDVNIGACFEKHCFRDIEMIMDYVKLRELRLWNSLKYEESYFGIDFWKFGIYRI